MGSLVRLATGLLLSAVFLLLVVPLGGLWRAVADPLRLQRAPQRASYLRAARAARATKDRP